MLNDLQIESIDGRRIGSIFEGRWRMSWNKLCLLDMFTNGLWKLCSCLRNFGRNATTFKFGNLGSVECMVGIGRGQETKARIVDLLVLDFVLKFNAISGHKLSGFVDNC
jgi:hypothetical protein